MNARQLVTATGAAIAMFAATGSAQAQGPWYTRPQDWGSQGVIVFPQRQSTGSTFPVVTGPPSRPPAPTPNYYQFQRYNAGGQAVFQNPSTGQTRWTNPNVPAPLGFQTTLGQVRAMQQNAPLGTYAPGRPAPNSRRP